ncbi:cell division suppressor protein YneA [Bacillus methanolicus]|uniref:cell division suppressor protein YneA n=1 Tax=Bacillus methanolicus TaxID=1471 RepID=UPI00237FF459|nr:LysM peptidoglycan-binding domain-containing protein [Bacillus methanolicus]MDE3838613.1 cell division suppressor protein YneA [Bacillus methanolicus]
MKKIWKRYSYAIILVMVSFTAALLFSDYVKDANSESYLKVTVEEGESLWSIAEKFSDKHGLSSDEFISWVERTNGINGDNIYPGEELVIPVLEKSEAQVEVTNYAGE